MEIVEDITINYLDPEKMEVTIDEYANLIRDDVYADPLKMYSNDDFENALYSKNIEIYEGEAVNETIQVKGEDYVVSRGGSSSILMDFVTERYESVMRQLRK